MDYFNLLDQALLELQPEPVQETIEIYEKELINKCCASPDLINDYENDIVICSSCGLVTESNFQLDSKGTTDETDNCNEDVELLDSSAVTTYVTGGTGRLAKSIRTQHKWAYFKSQGTSFQLFKELESLFQLLPEQYRKKAYLDTSKLYAKKLLGEGADHRIIKATPRQGFLRVCIYYSLLNNSNSITTDELCELMGISQLIFKRGMTLFKELENERELNYSKHDLTELKIIELANKLNLGENLTRTSLVYYDRIRKLNILNVINNSLLASTTIYFTLREYNQKIKRKAVLEVAGVNENTFKTQLKIITKHREEIQLGINKEEITELYGL